MEAYIIQTLIQKLEFWIKLEKVHTRMIKQSISLKQNTPNVVSYIISRLISSGGKIDLKY